MVISAKSISLIRMLFLSVILLVSQQTLAVVFLKPGVPTPLLDLFPVETTSEVSSWSLGLYSYADQPTPPYTISGGTTFLPGSSYYYGHEITGSAFDHGTDVYYAYQGIPQFAPLASGSITVNSDYEESSITIPLVVLQKQVLTGGVCDAYPDIGLSGYPCFSRHNIVEGSVTFQIAGETLPPSTLELAQMSNAVYSGSNSVGRFTAAFSTASNDGFFAEAFVAENNGSNKEQVVISIRGTDAFKNFLSYTGLDNYVAHNNALWQSYIAATTRIINQAQSLYPDSRITLTGHSLGGALAEYVGDYTGLQTETFNAPGTSSLLGSGALSGIHLLPTIERTGVIENHRVIGDIISLIGQPRGTITTYMPDDPRLQDMTIIDLKYPHDIARFVRYLSENNTHSANGAIGPNLLAESRLVYPSPSDILNPLRVILGFTVDVLADIAYWFDPPPVDSYEFNVISGPMFSFLVFSDLPTDIAYKLFLWDLDNWVFNGYYYGGDTVDFTIGGADRFLLLGYNQRTDQQVLLPSDLFIGIGFENNGMFVGQAILTATSVSEPSMITLFISLLFCLLGGLKLKVQHP